MRLDTVVAPTVSLLLICCHLNTAEGLCNFIIFFCGFLTDFRFFIDDMNYITFRSDVDSARIREKEMRSENANMQGKRVKIYIIRCYLLIGSNIAASINE